MLGVIFVHALVCLLLGAATALFVRGGSPLTVPCSNPDRAYAESHATYPNPMHCADLPLTLLPASYSVSSRRGGGRNRREAAPLRLCAVEGGQAWGANLGQPLGPWTAG